MPLIGPRTLDAFGDYFSRHVPLRKLARTFEAAGIRPRPGSAEEVGGERRQLAFEHYRALDLGSYGDALRLSRAFAFTLNDLEEEIEEGGVSGFVDDLRAELAGLLRRLREDGLEYASGQITGLTPPATPTRLVELARELNLEALTRQLDRLAASTEKDPEQVIGTSKEGERPTFQNVEGENLRRAWDPPHSEEPPDLGSMG